MKEKVVDRPGPLAVGRRLDRLDLPVPPSSVPGTDGRQRPGGPGFRGAGDDVHKRRSRRPRTSVVRRAKHGVSGARVEVKDVPGGNGPGDGARTSGAETKTKKRKGET